MIHKVVFIKRILFYCLITFFFLGCHTKEGTELPQDSLSCDSLSIGQEFSLKNPQKEKISDEEYVILADSLSYSPNNNQSSTNNHLLYTSILMAVAICILLVYKKRSYSKQLYSLKKDKQTSEQTLSQEIDKVRENRNQLFELYIKECPIYKEIALLLNKNKIYDYELLTPEKWDELFSAINSHTNKFTVRLQEEYPLLKIEDIRFCCLIKIGFSYADIACILGRTPNMMYKRREIISKRMGLKKSNKAIDKYIINF